MANNPGPIISGIALLSASVAAWVTYFKFHLKGQRDSWIEGYQNLYKELWDTGDNAYIRALISNDHLYTHLEKVLELRNAEDRNTLSKDDAACLDKLDKFLSIFARLRFWKKVGATKYQKELFQISFGHYWIKKINQRRQLVVYINKFWPGITDIE